MNQDHKRLFREGSTTYYNSTRFFPREVRRDVFCLYAFVRRADNFVDDLPQDRAGFYRYWEAWRRALSGIPAGDTLIDPFVALCQRRGIKSDWIEAFFHSMELDLEKSLYTTLDETIEYMYGSAEVIGLAMAKIMALPDEALEPARMLGRSMQYINFIRDIDEDNQLGRRYLPLEDSSLKDLSREETMDRPDDFIAFHQLQITRYRSWQEEAELGYQYIPWSYLVPIKTAADSYLWTAKQIEKDPFIVYRRKVKPKKPQILMRGLFNSFISIFL